MMLSDSDEKPVTIILGGSKKDHHLHMDAGGNPTSPPLSPEMLLKEVMMEEMGSEDSMYEMDGMVEAANDVMMAMKEGNSKMFAMALMNFLDMAKHY